VVLKAQAEYDRAQSDYDRAQSEATRQVEQAQHQMNELLRNPQQPVFNDRLQAIIKRAPDGAANALVIRSSDSDPKDQSELQEDLAVMSHILDKALDENLGGDTRGKAMGIDVFFTPNSSPVRSLYLEGYGALFMLKVRFPVLAPPAKEETQKEKQPEDSAWEEARRELFGQPQAGVPAPAPGEEYSEEKVSKLKDALLEALKNAANIRGLKSDESVTVCIFGGGSKGGGGARAVVRAKPANPPVPPVPPAPPLGSGEAGSKTIPGRTPRLPSTGWHVASGPQAGTPAARGTIMTIRVKKSDIEAFSKGKINLEEFRKKARITAYAGDAGGEESFSLIGSGGLGGGWGGSWNSFGRGSSGGGGGFGGNNSLEQ
jgi:hypothetical protein